MRRPTARAYAASAAALAALLTPGPAAQAAGTDRAAAAATVIEKVPYAMDSSNQAAWWTPAATYKGRGQYTYFAFNEPGSTAATHRPAIARRDPDGVWSRLPLLATNGQQAEFPDDNGHNQPSVARDGSGRLHVFTSMHANPWRYFRTDAPGGAVTDHSAELPDQGEAITYPVVTTAPNGDLYLAARVGNKLRPAPRQAVPLGQRRIQLERGRHVRRRTEPLRVPRRPDGRRRRARPPPLRVGQGTRDRVPAPALLPPLRPGDRRLRGQRGRGRHHPGDATTSDVIQELTTGEEWSIDNAYPGPAVQSAKLTLDGSTPKVAYRYRSADSGGNFRVYYAYPSGSNWLRQTVYADGQTTAALGITWDETDAGRVYYVTASGTDRVFAATRPGTTWTSQSAAPGVSADRLAVRRDSDGNDVLYLPDTAHNSLYYGVR